MSCLSELHLSVYADGELDGEPLREAEAHLVACRECRARVVALRDETECLRQSLQGLEPAHAHFQTRPQASAARGLALGALPTLGLVALLAAGLGFILETRVPVSIRWLNPMNLIGAYEMAFDSVFWLRQEAPALIDLLIAVAITASISAILTFGVTAVFRRYAGPLALGLVLFAAFLSPPASSALELVDAEIYRVAEGEVLNETLLVAGEAVYIEGVVEGDVAAFCERLVVTGEIRGNLFALAEEIEIDGLVTGSFYGGGEQVNIKGRVEGDLYMGGEDVMLAREAEVSRDVGAFGEGVSLDGRVGRDLYAIGERVEIRGNVARNAEARADRFELLAGARIAGDLGLTMPPGRQPQIAAAAVGGSVETFESDHAIPRDATHHLLTVAYYARLAVILTAGFVVGMALHALWPSIFGFRLETPADFFRSLGLGFAILIGAPVVLVIVAITIIGIPIAIMGLWTYLSALFLSGIAVAAVVGQAILRRGNDAEGTTLNFGLQLLVGLMVIGFFASLPWIGIFSQVVIALIGLGLLVERGTEMWRGTRLSFGR